MEKNFEYKLVQSEGTYWTLLVGDQKFKLKKCFFDLDLDKKVRKCDCKNASL